MKPIFSEKKSTAGSRPVNALKLRELDMGMMQDLDLGDYEWFKGQVLEMSGIDLDLYKEKQMRRRINTLIVRRSAVDYETFADMLHRDPALYEYFLDYITINVSEFFRTPEHWAYVEEHVLPKIIERSGGEPRLWSCACSIGEEPYSLVMSMLRYLPPERVHVLATDIDEKVLESAAEGAFDEKAMETMPVELRDRYFTKSGDRWIIDDQLRRCVEFQKIDLLKDGFPEEQDLIVCRNVLIYFTEEAKNRLYKRLRNSLREGGYLFTGHTEQLINHRRLGFKKETNYLYEK